MKLWDETETEDTESGFWFNGRVKLDLCDCGGRQDEEVEYSHSQAAPITVLVCRDCGKKVHGGEILR